MIVAAVSKEEGLSRTLMRDCETLSSRIFVWSSSVRAGNEMIPAMWLPASNVMEPCDGAAVTQLLLDQGHLTLSWSWQVITINCRILRLIWNSFKQSIRIPCLLHNIIFSLHIHKVSWVDLYKTMITQLYPLLCIVSCEQMWCIESLCGGQRYHVS